MKKNITKLLISLFCFLGYTNANAEPQKPIITVLHAGTKSDSGMEFSYPTDGKAKLILAQAIFPIGAVLPMHTHPSPVVVHVLVVVAVVVVVTLSPTSLTPANFKSHKP